LEELFSSAEKGDVEAKYLLGCRFFNGTDESRIDYQRAAEWLQKAAAEGHAGAQGLLGYMYVTACGVPVNVREGMEWLQKAAGQNDVHAQTSLADIYETGRGVVPDRFEAMDWYMKAAAQGDKDARKNLERLRKTVNLVRDSGHMSNEWWLVSMDELIPKAEQGDANAQRILGDRYKGYGGTELDFQKAQYWLERAAAQTNMQAHYSLSQLYVRLTNPVPEKAFYHCSLAAEGGYKTAQRVLGQYYRDGFGTAVDRGKALYWFCRAEQNGDDRAAKSLYSLIKGKADFKGLRKGQVLSEDYSSPPIELSICDLDNHKRTIGFVKYDPKTKQVETDYMFGQTNRISLSAFHPDCYPIIQNKLKHQAFDDLDLEISKKNLSREDYERLGYIKGKRGSSTYTYDGVGYCLEFKNRNDFFDLHDLSITSRCYYETSSRMTDAFGRQSTPKVTQDVKTETFKVTKIEPDGKCEFEIKPLVVESYTTEGGIYYPRDPTWKDSRILGIWVRVSCGMADGCTIYRDFFEPSALQSKVMKN